MAEVNALLTVKDLIKDKPVFIKSNNTIFDTAKEMKENNVTSVLIQDDAGNIAGIITESDIVRKVVAENLNPLSINVDKVMTEKLLTIASNESMFKARQIMLDNKVRHLIVTNNEKQIGVITAKEVLGD